VSRSFRTSRHYAVAHSAPRFGASIRGHHLHGLMRPTTPIDSRVNSMSRPDRTDEIFSPARRTHSPEKNRKICTARKTSPKSSDTVCPGFERGHAGNADLADPDCCADMGGVALHNEADDVLCVRRVDILDELTPSSHVPPMKFLLTVEDRAAVDISDSPSFTRRHDCPGAQRPFALRHAAKSVFVFSSVGGYRPRMERPFMTSSPTKSSNAVISVHSSASSSAR
jgi:hypothetical protein